MDFGDEPKATLRRGAGLWKVFVWDQELKRLLPRGDILKFGYDHSTRVPGTWLGGGIAREDNTAHGIFVAIIDQGEGTVSTTFRLVQEKDPEYTSPGRTGSEKHAQRAV